VDLLLPALTIFLLNHREHLGRICPDINVVLVAITIIFACRGSCRMGMSVPKSQENAEGFHCAWSLLTLLNNFRKAVGTQLTLYVVCFSTRLLIMSLKSPVNSSWCLHQWEGKNTEWKCSRSKIVVASACLCTILTR